MTDARLCSVEGCDRPVKARGWCKRHYEDWLALVPREERDQNYVAQKRLNSLGREVLLLELQVARGSVTATAQSLGVTRSHLRHFARENLWFAAAAKTIREVEFAPEKVQERNLEAKRRWRKRNPEQVREINRRWGRNQSPEDRAKWNHYNRARRSGLVLTKADEVAAAYIGILRNDPCSYCGSMSRPTVDHIVAVVNGGDNSWDNFTAACHSCNASKGAEELLGFLARRLVVTHD